MNTPSNTPSSRVTDHQIGKIEAHLIGPGDGQFSNITYCHVCGNNIDYGHMENCAWAKVKAALSEIAPLDHNAIIEELVRVIKALLETGIGVNNIKQAKIAIKNAAPQDGQDLRTALNSPCAGPAVAAVPGCPS